jgi:hypothetical protein
MAGPGKQGPHEVFVLLDGYDLTAESLTDLSVMEEAETAETTGLGDSFREHCPTGLARMTVELNGAIFNTCAGASHALLSTVAASPQSAARLAVIGLAGTSVGAEVEAWEGAHSVGYRAVASFEDLQRANATYEVTGARDPGYIIQPLTSTTEDGNSQSTAFDRAGVGWDTGSAAFPTTQGCVGHLQLTAFEGYDKVKVHLQDSSNDIAYATLVSFTCTSSTGAPVAERVTQSSEVHQYLAANWEFDGAGPGSAYFLVTASPGTTF